MKERWRPSGESWKAASCELRKKSSSGMRRTAVSAAEKLLAVFIFCVLLFYGGSNKSDTLLEFQCYTVVVAIVGCGASIVAHFARKVRATDMQRKSGHDIVEFSARAWPPQNSSPSLCEQSELQCFASNLRHISVGSKTA